MTKYDKDMYLVEEGGIKSMLRQPPLDVDGWFEKAKQTASNLNGQIVCSIEELREIWDKAWTGGVYAGMGLHSDQEFADHLKAKGIHIP